MVIVPMLAYIFTKQNVSSEVVQHLALGTSLASIMFTSLSSMRAHHGRGAVEWPIVWKITPGILAGGLIGSWLAAQLSTRTLKFFFVLFLFTMAAQLLLDIKPKTHKRPGSFGFLSVGSIIGGISTLVGIGGGTMSVPFILRCNVTMHNAINGLGGASLPANCLGYISLPALSGVALASILTAPYGARLAHRLPVQMLNKIFAGL